jgi:hypothetical protein
MSLYQEDTRNDQTKLAGEIANSLRNVCESSMVPIYVVQEGALRQHGTGTLLAVGSFRFLVTAAHVINEADKLGMPLFIAGSRLEELRGTRNLVREDRFDITIVELTPHLTKRLAGRKFLRLDDMDFRDIVTDGLFFVCGFPCEWNSIVARGSVVSPRYLGYVTEAFKGEMNSHSYDPRFHLLLSASKSSSHPINDMQSAFPRKLVGISGSAIWKTYTERQVTAEWQPDQARIVAIETMAYGDSHEIIRGTHVGCVLRILRDAYPPLRSVVQFHLQMNADRR